MWGTAHKARNSTQGKELSNLHRHMYPRRRQGPLPSYWQGLQRPDATTDYVYSDGAPVPQLPSPGLELPYAHWSWPFAALANDSEVDNGCVLADAGTAYDRWGWRRQGPSMLLCALSCMKLGCVVPAHACMSHAACLADAASTQRGRSPGKQLTSASDAVQATTAYHH